MTASIRDVLFRRSNLSSLATFIAVGSNRPDRKRSDCSWIEVMGEALNVVTKGILSPTITAGTSASVAERRRGVRDSTTSKHRHRRRKRAARNLATRHCRRSRGDEATAGGHRVREGKRQPRKCGRVGREGRRSPYWGPACGREEGEALQARWRGSICIRELGVGAISHHPDV